RPASSTPFSPSLPAALPISELRAADGALRPAVDRGSRDRAVFASCRARTLLRRARLRGSGAARAWLRDPDALRPLADGAADARRSEGATSALKSPDHIV